MKLPEAARAFRFHSFSGQSRNLPARRSSSASWNRKSSLPDTASCSICSRHTALSCSEMNAVSSANSFGESSRTALLISVRLTVEKYTLSVCPAISDNHLGACDWGRPSNASRRGPGFFVTTPQGCQMHLRFFGTSGPPILQKVCSRRKKSGPQ